MQLITYRVEEIDKKIREIEALTGEENQYWICGPETGEFLLRKIEETGAKTVLEIGTSVGYSALWMAKANLQLPITNPQKVEIYTVESHKERGDLAAEHFEGVPNITLVRGHAPEVLTEIPGTFDLVFFDATKYEHLDYFEAVYPRMNEGAMLIVDNVISHGEGNMMQKFLDKIKSHPELESEILEIGSGVLVGLKR